METWKQCAVIDVVLLSIVNFEQISPIVLVFLLLLWASKYLNHPHNTERDDTNIMT